MVALVPLALVEPDWGKNRMALARGLGRAMAMEPAPELGVVPPVAALESELDLASDWGMG